MNVFRTEQPDKAVTMHAMNYERGNRPRARFDLFDLFKYDEFNIPNPEASRHQVNLNQ